LVRGRSSDRGKAPVEAPAEPVAPSTEQQAPTASNVEKCVNCQYYDRRRARPTDGKAPMWGQCRKHSPHLNPVTAKAYVVEGVWPLVRDDDWCGEWRVLTRMPEEPLPGSTALPTEDAPAPAPAKAQASPEQAGETVAVGDDD